MMGAVGLPGMVGPTGPTGPTGALTTVVRTFFDALPLAVATSSR
jgi:hypothetical protein